MVIGRLLKFEIQWAQTVGSLNHSFNQIGMYVKINEKTHRCTKTLPQPIEKCKLMSSMAKENDKHM